MRTGPKGVGKQNAQEKNYHKLKREKRRGEEVGVTICTALLGCQVRMAVDR